MKPCARCGRAPVDGWRISGWTVCDRVGCVREASHGLMSGLLPDALEELDGRALAGVERFDARQVKNRPPPPPWKLPGYVRR